jgi:glyoxylase-like metal-dependent hydrolase (beta-lactamase superfamily II)
VGGLATADGQSAFPKAVIHMSAHEWAFMQNQPSNSGLVKVIAAQVTTFEPGGVVAPGVRAVALVGHTPGHTGYEISSGGARLIDIGDTAHSAIISPAKPDWDIKYDQDPGAGRANRRALLTRLAATHEWVFAPHFPFPGVGHVEARGDGFVWAPGKP